MLALMLLTIFSSLRTKISTLKSTRLQLVVLLISSSLLEVNLMTSLRLIQSSWEDLLFLLSGLSDGTNVDSDM
jgi:hypothetical protein